MTSSSNCAMDEAIELHERAAASCSAARWAEAEQAARLALAIFESEDGSDSVVRNAPPVHPSERHRLEAIRSPDREVVYGSIGQFLKKVSAWPEPGVDDRIRYVLRRFPRYCG